MKMELESQCYRPVKPDKYEKVRFKKIISKCCGYFAPAILPPLHIGLFYYLWHQYSRHVDKRYCSCSCWDTVFKGTYESGIASYKHVYFNATSNTLKMWVLTVSGIILLYECVKRFTLLAVERHLRLTMLILFLSSIFSHYYSWWAFLNYWNDDFYSQWNHQLFFSLTEIVSTILVVRLADSSVRCAALPLLIIVGIACIHILISGWDQFVFNVVQGEGYMHQVLRDLSFMIPDVLHVSLPLIEMKRDCCLRLNKEMYQRIAGVITFVILGFMIGSVI